MQLRLALALPIRTQRGHIEGSQSSHRVLKLRWKLARDDVRERKQAFRSGRSATPSFAHFGSPDAYFVMHGPNTHKRFVIKVKVHYAKDEAG